MTVISTILDCFRGQLIPLTEETSIDEIMMVIRCRNDKRLFFFVLSFEVQVEDHYLRNGPELFEINCNRENIVF